MEIRIASPADAAHLLEIYRPYVERTAVSFEYAVPSLAEFEGRIAHTLKRYPYLIAQDEGGILGYAYAGAFKEREAYQHGAELSVYVDWNRRRAGVGKLLYAALEEWLAKQNVHVLYACIACTDREDDPYLSPDSPHFHEALGFRYTGRYESCGYKFGRWYDMVWMEKRIHPAVAHPDAFVPFPEIHP